MLLAPCARRGAARAAHGSRVDAYVTKPVKVAALRRCLAELLGPPAADPVTEVITGDNLVAPGVESRPHLLVADDHPVNQRVAQRTLERMGYRVDVVVNGIEAVEAHSRTPYDAIIMDCQMPVMDGWTAAGEIRGREVDGMHVPIIAMTAAAMSGDRERCLAAGMDGYLSKPVKPEELEKLLAVWAPVRRLPRPSATVDAGDGGDPARSLDAEHWAALLGLGLMELRPLVGAFIEDAAARIVGVRQAVHGGDCAEVARIAHALQGSAGALGGYIFAATCADLEEIALRGDLRPARSALVRLEADFGYLRAALLSALDASG